MMLSQIFNFKNNKIKKIALIAFFLLTLFNNLSIGQIYYGDKPGLKDNKDLFSQSPQTSDFMRYGNNPVSYFTGETNVTIPIYTYKDNDFELPVFIGYNSAGFYPNKSEGIVGLNWSLNAGGVITRKVNGMPDDKAGLSNFGPIIPHGLYAGITNHLGVETASKTDIFNNLTGTVDPDRLYWYNNYCEFEPDEFSFSAPGCNGKFFIENNGTVHCEGNKNYTVSLEGFAIQPYSSGVAVENSTIVITSDIGYKYYFGGSIQYLEVSYPLINFNELQLGTSQIMAWHLNKIVAPNLKEATFHYLDFDTGLGQDTPSDTIHYVLNAHYEEFEEYTDNTVGHSGFISGTGASPYIFYGTAKTAYLKDITVGQSTIEFEYVQRASKFFPNENSVFNQKTMELKNVNIKYSGSTKNTFTFNYSDLGGTNGQRRFLSSFQKSGEAPYTFSYYNTSQIPNPLTKAIDYWGFWNDRSTTASLIPTTTIVDGNPIYAANNNREPDESKCNVAMLEQINYPTGGNTHFSYEGHYYSKRLERRTTNGFLPALYDQVGLAGGCRIHEIKDNDGLGNVMTKIYDYSSNYPSSTTSSGILLEWPMYVISWNFNSPGTTQYTRRKRSNSFNTSHSNAEKYIQYSEVTERIEPTNGYTIYKFTDYKSNPDTADYHTKTLNPGFSQYVSDSNLWNNYIGMKLNDCSFQRGYPYEISVYSGSGSILKKKETTAFTSISDYPDNYSVSVMLTGGIAQSHKLYYVPFLPKTEVETSYFVGGSVATTKNYTYNSYNLVSEMTQDNSTGGIFKNKIRYVVDCKNNAPYNSMFTQNILKHPVENTSLLDGNITGSTLTTYKVGGGSFVPDKTYELQTLNPISSFTYYDGANKDPNYNTTEAVIYQDYDSNGNILKYKKKNGITTYLFWGYSNKYVVASIDATNNSLDPTTLTTIRSDISGHPFTSDIPTEVAYLKLQLSTYLSNTSCVVNLYTFSPLIGMTSQTDPNGKTTYYEYDTFGRLQFIKDDQGKIIKKYDYHYSTAN